MSAKIRADIGGSIAAIQVNGVDRLTLDAAGALLASANPATGLRSMALATMQKFADEFSASLIAAGWQRLASGLILQWGTVSEVNIGNNNSVVTAVTFPIAFPNAVFCVVPSAQGANPECGASLSRSAPPTLTGFSVQLKNYVNNNQLIGANWFAIGR